MTKSSVQTPLLDEAQEIVAPRAPQPQTPRRLARSWTSSCPLSSDGQDKQPSRTGCEA